jgi:hypothetical protein
MNMKKLFALLVLLGMLNNSDAQRKCIAFVNIIDVEKGVMLPNQHVLINNGLIESITDAAKNGVPITDSMVMAKGMYLIPGLWDMHTHIWASSTTFPLLIANGVTGVRGMFEQMSNVATWQKEMASGEIDDPQLKVAGPIVDGPKPIWPGSVAVSNAAEGRKAVDSLKNTLKTDFIKVYSLLGRDSYFAIADESMRQQIPFAGHVPNTVSVVEAAKAGQASQEHLYGFIEAASDSAAYWFQYLEGGIKDSRLVKRADRKAFLFRTYSEDKLASVLSDIKSTNTYICPTLTVNRGIAYIDDTLLLQDERMQYMGNFMKNFWDYRKDFRFKSWTPQDFADAKKEYEIKLGIVRKIHQAGIPILAGTDFPNPHCYIGFGIHDELKLLVKAGLSAAEALQTATTNPAKYFGLLQQEGTVAVGKKANLILLQQNPLQDIAHTSAIEMVVLAGKFFSASQLAELKLKVSKMVAGASPAAPLQSGFHLHEDE